LKGGGIKEIPLYKEPKNSPHVPVIQKQIMTEKFKENQKFKPRPKRTQQNYPRKPFPSGIQKPPSAGGQPLVDLQVYDTQKPTPKPPYDPAALYRPFMTTTPFFPPQYAQQQYQMPPVIKNYNIRVEGPVTDHGKVGTIIEDVMPSKQFVNTSNTVGERTEILDFIRSSLIKSYDGEDVDLDGSGQNSLLSYLKFIEINPYSTNHFSNNPYKGLPDDMLIYRSCYPIRYDKYGNAVQCAANSVGMNIRIYRLTTGEYKVRRMQQNEFFNYNIWRELAYYEYIREYIIKQKVSPNFVIMYGYFINQKCKIDFNKILKLKGKHRKETKKYQPLVQPNSGQNQKVRTLVENKDAYIGKAIVALTESPNYNIYGWSSRTYKVQGNIRRMVNTGFHKTEVWNSILFQLAAALYVLQIHKIAFNDFTIEDNVYIKDVTTHGNITRYYKYIINGFEYYVPNYGYLVMIDSNYKDIRQRNFTIDRSKNNKIFKLYGDIFDQDEKTRHGDDINNLCFEAFSKSFNPNAYSNAFKNIGGTKPSEKIVRLLSSITKKIQMSNKKDISYYIENYLTMFLNNRVGTYLKETETKNVRSDDFTEFKQGQMVVQQVQHRTYKFVIFCRSVDGMAEILTKLDPTDETIIKSAVPKSSLVNYNIYEPILQKFKPNRANLNEDDMMEIYTINKN